MSSATPFGKRIVAVDAVDRTTTGAVKQRPRFRSFLPPSWITILVAIVLLPVSADYVWSKVNSQGRTQFFEGLTENYGFYDFLQRNMAIYKDSERLLGIPSEHRRQPTYGETMKFANDLPNRFEEVARQLADASNRDRKRPRSLSKSDTDHKRQTDWREASLQDVLALRKNARSELAGASQALGINSSPGDDSQFAEMEELMESLATDWSSLDHKERVDTIVAINKMTAAIFNDMVPMPTAYGGVYLHAIEPVGTKVRYIYRIDVDRPGSVVAEISDNLTGEICNRQITGKMIRHGGTYEVLFVDPNDQRINKFIITEAECR